MKNFYLVALERYAYHLPHVRILSKNSCGQMRQNWFNNTPGALKTTRDYAERMSAAFNFEAQHEHFGNDRDLSIEGVDLLSYTAESLEDFDKSNNKSDLKTIHEFHSHFLDNSKQDAATTHAHMPVLFDLLKRLRRIKGLVRTLLLDNTDGCAKQYRCGTALFLLSLLVVLNNVIIDWAVGAPGHGKDVVDGLNATDKRYLKQKINMVSTPEENDSNNRMSACSMVEEEGKSLAKECAQLCSDTSRVAGVKSDAKYAKREASAALKIRNYHVQKGEDVQFEGIKMEAQIPKSKHTYNGLTVMYNLRADPDLGVGRIALRRIPCACSKCTEQTNKPWALNVKLELQPRYSQNTECEMGPIFHGLNDWRIIEVKPATKEDHEEDFHAAQDIVLESLVKAMTGEVKEGNVGAFATEDPESDGYYVVRFKSVPYALTRQTKLTEYNPAIVVEEGALVVDAEYLNMVPWSQRWYIPSSLQTTVRLQQVVHPNLTLGSESGNNSLPNGCNKRSARNLGARHVNE
jgi:hypothetical protein